MILITSVQASCCLTDHYALERSTCYYCASYRFKTAKLLSIYPAERFVFVGFGQWCSIEAFVSCLQGSQLCGQPELSLARCLDVLFCFCACRAASSCKQRL
jgi:hypothetical protein